MICLTVSRSPRRANAISGVTLGCSCGGWGDGALLLFFFAFPSLVEVLLLLLLPICVATNAILTKPTTNPTKTAVETSLGLVLVLRPPAEGLLCCFRFPISLVGRKSGIKEFLEPEPNLAGFVYTIQHSWCIGENRITTLFTEQINGSNHALFVRVDDVYKICQI